MISTTHPDPRKCRTWRDRFRPHIAQVIADTQGQSPREVRKALRELWDELGMGPRRMHPYKVWCSEVRRQLHVPEKPAEIVDEGQLALFEEGREHGTGG